MQMTVVGPDTVLIIDKLESNPLKDDQGKPVLGAVYSLKSNTPRPIKLITNSFCAGGGWLSNGTSAYLISFWTRNANSVDRSASSPWFIWFRQWSTSVATPLSRSTVRPLRTGCRAFDYSIRAQRTKTARFTRALRLVSLGQFGSSADWRNSVSGSRRRDGILLALASLTGHF